MVLTSDADPATALGAWATLGALLAAVLAAFYAAGAFRLEAARDERASRAHTVQQASRVAAWHDFLIDEAEARGSFQSGGLTIPLGVRTERREGLFLRNASELPVSNVEFQLWLGGMPLRPCWIGVLPPGSEPTFRDLDSFKLFDEDSGTDFERPDITIIGGDFLVGLAFRDMAGRDWFRTPQGALHQTVAPWRHDGPGDIPPADDWNEQT